MKEVRGQCKHKSNNISRKRRILDTKTHEFVNDHMQDFYRISHKYFIDIKNIFRNCLASGQWLSVDP